jgi:hypothetical protein
MPKGEPKQSITDKELRRVLVEIVGIDRIVTCIVRRTYEKTEIETI